MAGFSGLDGRQNISFMGIDQDEERVKDNQHFGFECWIIN
jgi:hypothetical protein